jgi:glycerophosphoryl diester phosphodiesterase
MAELTSRRTTLKAASSYLVAGTFSAAFSDTAALAVPLDRPGTADAPASFPWPPQGRPSKPYVIGHRGAPAHRPELTLASFAKAIADGADFVEIDLMMTKDGELVIRHDIQLDYTTDISNHPEFAHYRRTKSLYGNDVTAWFVDDVTLAELKTLRIVDRTVAGGDPGRPEAKAFDGWFQILTFGELNDFLDAMESIYHRKIGLVVELKMTTYFEGAGFPIAKRLVHSIKRSHYLKTSPIIIQSFEISPLQGLFKELSGYANIQFQVLVGSLSDRPADFRTSLLDRSWAELLAPGQIARVKEFTNWLGMSYSALAPVNADGPLGGSRNLINAAHDESLLVSAWTFRPENKFLAQDLRSSGIPMERNASGSISEMRRYLALGLDGIITDDPGLGRKAVDGQK